MMSIEAAEAGSVPCSLGSGFCAPVLASGPENLLPAVQRCCDRHVNANSPKRWSEQLTANLRPHYACGYRLLSGNSVNHRVETHMPDENKRKKQKTFTQFSPKPVIVVVSEKETLFEADI